MPLGLVTTTSKVPAGCGPVRAVNCAELRRKTSVAEIPPIFTVAPLTKPEPPIVTEVPPRLDPNDGEIEVTVTPGRYVKPFVLVTEAPFGFVMTTLTAPAA